MFLNKVGIEYQTPWVWEDTVQAHKAWDTHVTRRRERKASRRPVADVLIGAFALRFDGLLTRNVTDFATLFPGLNLNPVKEES